MCPLFECRETGDGSLSPFWRPDDPPGRPGRVKRQPDRARAPLCSLSIIPSALLRSPFHNSFPCLLCIHLMLEFAGTGKLAHSAGMILSSQSAAMALSGRLSARPSWQSQRQLAVSFLRSGIKQAVCGMKPPDGMRTTVSSPSFLPSERAPFRKRIPASNGCTNGLDTRRQRASEGVQME